MSDPAGRLIGLDVGRKRIGVAVSDPLGITAQGLEVWTRGSLEEDLERLSELAARCGADRCVVGLPLRTDGTPGPEAEYVRRFAGEIERRLGLEVILWDERFTTKEAERVLIGAGVGRRRRRGVVDMTAASLILDGYLARLRRERKEAGSGHE